MKPHDRVISMLVLVPLVLTAQVSRDQDAVPLKNWPAPLYWQASLNDAQRIAREGLEPRQVVGGAVTAPLVFVGMAPCRVMDTRSGSGFMGSFGPPSIAGGTSRTVPIQQSTCPIPATAQAYSLNVTVVPQGFLGYLTIWPTGETQPTVSTLNDGQGQVLANAAVVPGGTNGSVNIYVTNTTDVILDINGYYASPSSISLGPGTATAPSLTFSNDATSGLYSSGAGTVNVAAGGANKLTVTSTGVGIGTTPAYPLDVAGDIDFTGSLRYQGNPILRMPGGLGSGNNLALGLGTLQSNTAGYNNTAIGFNALLTNTTGDGNTAIGAFTLQNSAFGNTIQNTAIGAFALQSNTSSGNTATGYIALVGNTTGGGNTATGGAALQDNSTGSFNTATGISALWQNLSGNNNVANGPNTLYSNISGSNNIAIGYQAGYNVTTSNNIHIGSTGVSTDNGTIRIGTPGTQTSFFAAGINGVQTGLNNAVPVLIDGNGQLGTANSSRRFKEDVSNPPA